MLKYLLAVGTLLCLLSPAEARQHRHHHHHSRHHLIHIAAQASCTDLFCWLGGQQASPAVTNPRPRLARGMVSYGRGEIVSHPASCPRVAYCGCGAAVRVFGHSVRELWLAANWFRFPRAAPAPGMAAVRAHHVFILEADLGGGNWLVFDANSGNHLTRIHARSLVGYTIVNPHA
jgi:hypothetical protein